MANNTVLDRDLDDFELEEDFSPDDFEFTIGSDGELKSMFIPQNLMNDPPKQVMLILKLYGIEDINFLEPRTIH